MKQYVLTTVLAMVFFNAWACGDHSQSSSAGSASSSGAGGDGGVAECVTADDCIAPVCQVPHCTSGVCHYSAFDNGALCSDTNDAAGRCQYGHCVPHVYCDDATDCANVPRALCHDVPCYNGICWDVPTPLGEQCQNSGNPSDICDGRGVCGRWMPYGGPECYVPNPLPYSVCPTCDDGDPTTRDECKPIGGLMQCTHEQLPEMYECGPWYYMQGGKCCPVPETVPPT